jgi:hypothetical protein
VTVTWVVFHLIWQHHCPCICTFGGQVGHGMFYYHKYKCRLIIVLLYVRMKALGKPIKKTTQLKLEDFCGETKALGARGTSIERVLNWSSDLVLYSDRSTNPDALVFESVLPYSRCSCPQSCRFGECTNSLVSIYCDRDCCLYGGVCG